MHSSNVNTSPGAPVHAVIALQESAVDEVSAQHDMVEEEAPQEHVHLFLLVSDPGLELQGDALQHDAPLRVFGGHLGEAPVAEERSKDGFLVVVRRAQSKAGGARRAHLLRGPAEGLRVQSVGPSVGIQTRDARGAQPVQVLADPCDGDAERLGQVARPSVGPRQRPGDREPLGVGERAKDLIRGLRHVGLHHYHAGVDLTDPQRRTFEGLIGTGLRPSFPADLPQRLRDRIEEAVRGLELRDPIWFGKEKLKEHARCEGKFLASLKGEGPPFEHSSRSALGVLLHTAIEVDVGSRDGSDPHRIASIAADRLRDREPRFNEYWRALETPEKDDVLMAVVRSVTLFQASFPPLRDLRRELAPVTELRVRAELLGGDLVLSGQIDLVLGMPVKAEPTRATRLAIDLKTGGAYPEYPEDMRFYALLMTLRFGVPPYRAASLFLESGEWQAEDVTEEGLLHAADRVIAAVRAAAALLKGRDPQLTPGPYCAWCPRSATCPVAELPERSAI